MSSICVTPVILCGGAGTRLWPLSRATLPKQLWPLIGDRTMLQQTVRRLGADGAPRFAPPVIVCNGEHQFLVREQLDAIGAEPGVVLLEAVGRNTAPAAAAAALVLMQQDESALMLVLPADHHVADEGLFRAAVEEAAAVAAQGALVMFGVVPDRPETGYGYIRRGAALNVAGGCFRVEHFAEKPGPETARAYVDSGIYLWNSGIFLFKAARFVEELSRHAPATLAAARGAVAGMRPERGGWWLEEAALAGSEPISIDCAVMERTEHGVVRPVEMGWSDVGSWAALWESAGKDAAGNAIAGDVLACGLSGCYIRANGRLVAALGLKDVVVVDTSDALLVMGRDCTADLRQVVEAMKQAGRAEHEHHRRVHRPWGHYEGVDRGTRHQVKHIVVKPGAKLSLQRHAHRAEHWVVVQGRARVTRDDRVFDLAENESTYIPVGCAHRLENPWTVPLHLIEVQSGSYLGEDDIVRLEDSYGRAPG